MQKIVCENHGLKLCIPTNDMEFCSCKMHDDVIKLESHYRQFPTCKFYEVDS